MSKAQKRMLITAGPTRESIDDVRYLSNRSTGRMGIEIAAEAADRGWEVELVLGPTELEAPEGVTVTRVESAAEMFEAVRQRIADADCFVAAAAVADYTPARRIPGKLKKTEGPMQLELVRTVDILAWVGEQRRDRLLAVGFALEADPNPAIAMRKLRSKRCDMIVHNTPDNFGKGGGRVTVLGADGGVLWQGSGSKAEFAAALMGVIERMAFGRD
jgi:phosphopantothenoylcysteine decarboxylase/phosphopantothenate--cysteine ligase